MELRDASKAEGSGGNSPTTDICNASFEALVACSVLGGPNIFKALKSTTKPKLEAPIPGALGFDHDFKSSRLHLRPSEGVHAELEQISVSLWRHDQLDELIGKYVPHFRICQNVLKDGLEFRLPPALQFMH